MKKAAHSESKSLKTFYLYSIIVLFFIIISLAIKVFFIIEHSKFDALHQFTLAIIQKKDVKEIISFHPQTTAISVLMINDPAISPESLAKNYGITTDGYISADENLPLVEDTTDFLWSAILHMTDWQSNLTIFDKMRLLLLSKNVTSNNNTIDQISLTKQTPETNTIITNALTDQDLSSENISIQVVNATGVSGLGQRLERVLTNLGANVVDVSTAENTQNVSNVAYFGNESYTLSRVERLMNIKATKLTRQQIADIIITIGNDKRNTTSF
jgi:hypothetical protein